MNTYNEKSRQEMEEWRTKMLRKPSFSDKITKGVQDKVNQIIPEKVHNTVTTIIRQMVRAVLFGAEFTSKSTLEKGSLFYRESLVKDRLEFYKKTAAAEGAITGAGGILMGLADFPILMAIKLKFLYEVAGLYGYDLKNYKERIYLLHIFQLAFSSQHQRINITKRIIEWEQYVEHLPEDLKEFDWRSFQQEYRDYIDLAKLAQLIPFIGAAVGAVVNYRLLDQLGATAMNAYRLRYFKENNIELT